MSLSTNAPSLRNLSAQLIGENGGGFGFVCIWRPGATEAAARYGLTVGDWLSDPEHQSGTWHIDGGWGGPPGPIHVRWNAEDGCWENGGFCGRRFQEDAAKEP